MSVINLYQGDSLAAMREMPDKAYSLAITDPPYGIKVNMNAGRKRDTRSKKREIKQWDNDAPCQDYFDELFRVSKNQIIWGANHMIDKITLPSQGWIFWDKCVAEGCSFSFCLLAWTSFSRALKKATIPYSGFIGMEGEKFHPTTKPIKLYRWLLKNYANPGDTILDTHLGSMSIALACHDMGFDLDGWKLDEDYYQKGVARYQQHIQQLQLFQP